MTLQGAMTHNERVCQRQEAFLCKQATILQEQMEKIATLISKMEKMDTVKSKVVFIIQELRGQVSTLVCFCYNIYILNVNVLLYAVYRVVLYC